MHWEQSERVRRTLGKLVWPAGYGISTLNAWVSPQITAQRTHEAGMFPPTLVVGYLPTAQCISKNAPVAAHTSIHPLVLFLAVIQFTDLEAAGVIERTLPPWLILSLPIGKREPRPVPRRRISRG